MSTNRIRESPSRRSLRILGPPRYSRYQSVSTFPQFAVRLGHLPRLCGCTVSRLQFKKQERSAPLGATRGALAHAPAGCGASALIAARSPDRSVWARVRHANEGRSAPCLRIVPCRCAQRFAANGQRVLRFLARPCETRNCQTTFATIWLPTGEYSLGASSAAATRLPYSSNPSSMSTYRYPLV